MTRRRSSISSHDHIQIAAKHLTVIHRTSSPATSVPGYAIDANDLISTAPSSSESNNSLTPSSSSPRSIWALDSADSQPSDLDLALISNLSPDTGVCAFGDFLDLNSLATDDHFSSLCLMSTAHDNPNEGVEDRSTRGSEEESHLPHQYWSMISNAAPHETGQVYPYAHQHTSTFVDNSANLYSFPTTGSEVAPSTAGTDVDPSTAQAFVPQYPDYGYWSGHSWTTSNQYSTAQALPSQTIDYRGGGLASPSYPITSTSHSSHPSSNRSSSLQPAESPFMQPQ